MRARLIRPILRCYLASLILLAAVSTPVRAQILTVTPQTVSPGTPVLIHLQAPVGQPPHGEWLGRSIPFVHTSGTRWLAIAGVDVEQEPGPSTLTVHLPDMQPALLRRKILIRPAHYRTGRLSVAPNFVAPSAEELDRIHAEEALKKQIFSSSAGAALWSGRFVAPAKAPPTDSFGTRRTFNGQLASIHKGMDFLTPVGTPVHAANSGTVVLARPLFYEGNCVVVDHGQGLFTLSMHLSRIDVSEGQHVVSGSRLGLSGSTGRVTGPHLHWAVRWQGGYLDPAKFLRLNLPLLLSPTLQP